MPEDSVRRGAYSRLSSWLTLHTVELAFGVVAAVWLWYILRLTRAFYFWSDDLQLIKQAGSWRGVLRPYNQALTVPTLFIWRISAEVAGLSFTPLRFAGAVSLLAVPVTYFVTTRRLLGPPLAAILAMPLLWATDMNLRPADLNHFLALVGGTVCAAALNRGRRADGVLAAALAFSLCSAGGGVVVAGACLVHSLIMRPPLRRWLAILLPTLLYAVWFLLASPHGASHSVGASEKIRIGRDFFLAPFYQVSFGFWPVAALLVVAFFVWGYLQLRQGIGAGANFIAWTLAMVAWPFGLIQSRGTGADANIFRYAIVSLGFALLAVVPRRPIKWPDRLSVTNRSWLAVAAVVVLVFGGLRALDARDSLQRFSEQHAAMGRKAKATMLILQLGPGEIPDDTPVPFFGIGIFSHGTAGQTRALMTRYGALARTTAATVDQDVVDLRAPYGRLGPFVKNVKCKPLSRTLTLAPTSFGEAQLSGDSRAASAHPLQYKLWTKNALTIDVRRFGDHWVHLVRVPARHDVYLVLPVLATEKPWKVSAAGACLLK